MPQQRLESTPRRAWPSLKTTPVPQSSPNGYADGRDTARRGGSRVARRRAVVVADDDLEPERLGYARPRRSP